MSSHLRSGMSRGSGEKASGDKARGLVHREVVRVVTPGTVVEPALLDDRRNNYLAALFVERNQAGLAYADISTGEFAATELDASGGGRIIAEELTRLQPAELLVPDPRTIELPILTASLSHPQSPVTNLQSLISNYDAWRFDLETARQVLLDHFAGLMIAAVELNRCD